MGEWTEALQTVCFALLAGIAGYIAVLLNGQRRHNEGYLEGLRDGKQEMQILCDHRWQVECGKRVRQARLEATAQTLKGLPAGERLAVLRGERQ
jgi:hypothetical protein